MDKEINICLNTIIRDIKYLFNTESILIKSKSKKDKRSYTLIIDSKEIIKIKDVFYFDVTEVETLIS